MDASLDNDQRDKQHVARKTTVTSIGVNLVAACMQIAAGLFTHSQALIADGVHSCADLVSDFVVLLANRQSAVEPDGDHNYGHNRYETVASLFLGALLIAVGIGMLWRAGERLTNLDLIPAVRASALAVALVVLATKETLFRYMLREAQRVRSAMLIANAWHARSDAASSLVVALGILGSLAGVRLLDPIAAAIVGFMVARMGWTFGWDALQDLSDRALDERTSTVIRQLLLSSPGVRDVHELRTRKMGDYALVDAHILVDPLISVSEGHYIAESARHRVMSDARVLDALIHVDPENDLNGRPAPGLPGRTALTSAVQAALGPGGVAVQNVNIHYLKAGIDLDVTLAEAPPAAQQAQTQWLEHYDLGALQRRLGVRRISLARALPARGAAAPVDPQADPGPHPKALAAIAYRI